MIALQPLRYIITTSVGLNPSQKEKIQKLFFKFINSRSDIFGKQDLNNLLGLFSEIEKQHFKLWLSSSNILDRIIQGRIYNQSAFEEDEIKATIKTYVENDSYLKGLNIVKDKKYVIISGIPGIGKTTLARILVYHFLGQGFEEFIFLSGSIQEGFDLFKEGKSQVFLFDDFLGRNFLHDKLPSNEDSRIVKFIEKISSSSNKILILTTREYILMQAKQRYDLFENLSLDFAKCIIDLSQYTKMVRAKILFNHLYFSSITQDYISNIISSESYRWIIQHRNYSPRLIKTITSSDVWKNIKPDTFSDKILHFFDSPESIWKHVYENQISLFSQCVLANLMSAGTPMMLEDLKFATQSFLKMHIHKYRVSYNEIDFLKSIKELENIFIITDKDRNDKIAVDYQNPSVQDFLVSYFQSLPDFTDDLVKSATFFNQLFKVFSVEDLVEDIDGNWEPLVGKKIHLRGSSRYFLADKIISDYEYLKSSVVMSHYEANLMRSWNKSNYSEYQKLNDIVGQFYLPKHPILNILYH